MPPQTTRQWVIAERPGGREVRASDFRLEEADLPALGEGQVLARTLWLGFDPAQRSWMDNLADYVAPTEVGGVMPGSGVAQVVDSRSSRFQPGDVVFGLIGWREMAVLDGRALSKAMPGVPPQAHLGILGTTGLTAYFGFTRIGLPRPGDTVVVSGAAGSTGSAVGQIAKIAGCTVIGIAGGAEKCRWIVEECGFDHAVDYKAERVGARLDDLALKGVDVFFDNVGGETLDAVLGRIAPGGRVVVCGAISQYNTDRVRGPGAYLNLILRRARMEGFIVTDFQSQFPAAVARLAGWLKGGKLVYAEDVQEGFDQTPQTFLRLFTGANRGKQLLKVAAPEA